MDQLCKRAYVAFDNWFRNILCTHNLFCHSSHFFNFVKYLPKNQYFAEHFISLSQLEKIKGNLIPQPEVSYFLMKGSYYPAIDKETQHREELPATEALSLKRIS